MSPLSASPWCTGAAIVACVLLGASVGAEPKPPATADIDAAQTLYRKGLLPDGQPLRGTRPGSEPIEGQAAACANCHRRSGFGVEEGRIVIPPITGKYLFREGTTDAIRMAHPGAEAATPRRRSRYTSETLTRAIREGVDPDGRKLDYLMPRYMLDDASMALLIGYLKELSVRPAPGAVGDILQFATVVTPDADPVKRDAMLEVLNHFFINKNAFYRGDAPPLQSERRIHFRVLRRWQLHVWQLEGSPETWEAQLHRSFQNDPVFAVLSGIGARTWEPVHRFCESQAIPCVLPNIDLPVVDESDFYPVYFSRGVLLEADVIANRLSHEGASANPLHVVEIYRPDDIGAAAARQLAVALASGGANVISRELKGGPPAPQLAHIARETSADDVLVLWLRPADLKALPSGAKTARRVFVSGLMGGLEAAPLPASWREAARMTYPFSLPQQRAIAMHYPLDWFRVQHIAVVDERLQTDTYLACSTVAQVASTMLDNFVPDYLLERMEVELSHRIVNGYYPRFGLAPGQRFASKGAYLVRFPSPAGEQVVADGDWVVP